MRTCLPILSALVLLSACDSGGVVTHKDTHSHGNISGVREGVWPPEPLDMENEQLLPAQLRPRARQSVVEIARRSVMNNPDLLSAIGDDYGTFDATLSTSKGDDVASFLFYNYTTDQSVEAILGRDGSVSVRTQPASEWQPTENSDEVEQAIALARTSLEADGFVLDNLEGTAMLTYPANASSDSGTPVFYDTRILYVTFGNGDGEPPLYSARVDIGAKQISEGGPMR
ncbi:MAG: hypothetical protein AB8B87_20315 [Granulosicoccus sp.]